MSGKMRTIKFVLVSLLVVLLIPSCKKKDDAPAVSKLNVQFSNEVDGKPIVLGPIAYTNASGNPYGVDLLKYYISNFTLVKADGSEQNYKNYALIDASDTSKFGFSLDTVANGDYIGVKFLLGIDSAHNHTINQTGALDPMNAMIWSWNTGYIFFKHEGNYKNTTGDTKPLVFHYGTDAALVHISLSFPTIHLSGKDALMHLKFNLNNAYTTPANIDFNVDNFRQSSTMADANWIENMHDNFADAFSFASFE